MERKAKMDTFMASLNYDAASCIIEIFLGPRILFAIQTIVTRIDSRLYVQRQF